MSLHFQCSTEHLSKSNTLTYPDFSSALRGIFWMFFRLWDEEEEAQKRSHIQNITEILSFASIPWSLWFECKNVYGQLLITGLFLTTNINSLLSATGKRNLVVPYKRVCHQSQLHIVYMFYTYFFSRNPLRWVPDMSDPSRTPSPTSTTTTWWSHTSEFVIEVKLKY